MKKKSVALVVVGIVIAVLLGVIALLLFKMNTGEAKPVAKVTTTEIPKNETGITVENSSISFANMKLGNEKLHLSDEQKEVLGYFDNDYFMVYSYEDLQRYPNVYNKDTKIMCLDYYDSDLKKLWSREFENTTSFPMDYTSDEVALVADNDFYLIDTKNGKDKIKPTFVGEKLRVIMDEKGVLLFGKTKKDLVMNVDYKGQIKWTVDAKHKILYNDEYDENIEGLQIVNGNYVLVYTGDDDSEKATDEYNFGVGTCYLVIDKSGNVVLDENNKPDYYNY